MNSMKNEKIQRKFGKTIDNIYIYIIRCAIFDEIRQKFAHFCYIGGIFMRIILDTDKKTIMLPWNYRAKLEEINKLIADVSDDPQKQKTFTGSIGSLGVMRQQGARWAGAVRQWLGILR